MDNPLKEMEYPGRGVFLGITGNNDVFAGTFVEGRSPSSQARRYLQEASRVYTSPTDPGTLAQGNPELLLYNALLWFDDVIVAANGKQSDSILAETLCSMDRLDSPIRNPRGLELCAGQWNYEPDKPNYTPRIHGRLITNPADFDEHLFELGIISRNDDGSAFRKTYTVRPEPGTAAVITTYTGENKNPLPSFAGSPLVIPVSAADPKAICEEIGDMLNPDLRVGVAAVVMERGNDFHGGIINYRG